MTSDIAQRVKAIRKALGESQEAFGVVAGVNEQAVSRWENDKDEPPPKRLALLAEGYGFSPLLWEKGVPIPATLVNRRVNEPTARYGSTAVGALSQTAATLIEQAYAAGFADGQRSVTPLDEADVFAVLAQAGPRSPELPVDAGQGQPTEAGTGSGALSGETSHPVSRRPKKVPRRRDV
jgi:transcriptional regulator with XRE-family HTH domain